MSDLFGEASKKRWLRWGAPAFLLVAVCGVWLFRSGGSKSEAQSRAAAVPVEVVELSGTRVPIIKELPGRTAPFEVAEIRPQVTGIVTERLFVEGSNVEQGQQLYQIDPAPYEAANSRALADLEKAKANVSSVSAKAARYEKLVKIGAVSKQAYDDISAELAQAKADVSIAEASLATTRINLGYTKVYAPISGKIGKSLVTKGALVTANQTDALTTITKLDPIYVDMVQPSAELIEARASLSELADLPVELIMENQEVYRHAGKLQFVDVTVRETTGSVQLRAIVPNPDGQLLPGLFVRTRLQIGTTDALLLPQRAATRAPDGSLRVWVMASANTVEQRTVSARTAIEDAWLVQDGLKKGDRVVVKGIQKLTPESVVEVTELASATVNSEEHSG